jgi:2-keto-4-pentenoate hydratase/2-oxohepta-3-ene-1,7-dioic acid hydratase in catechol pathway
MKLTTFLTANGSEHIGAVLPDESRVVDFTASDPSPAFRDMLSLIDGGPAALAKARTLKQSHALSSVKLLAPLPRPRRLRDCLAFEKHVRQSRANRYLFGQGKQRVDPATIEIPRAWYSKPVYYKGNTFSIVGPEAEVHWPAYSQVIDYELEIALVTGKAGKNLPKGASRDHVFGYMIFNDFSARDAQYIEMQTGLGPAKGKDFDTGNVLGPWIVTRDEIGDPHNLNMEVRVNGERWGGGNSSKMHHKFPAILAFISQSETLHAGEVIGSGTVGTGSSNEIGRQIKSGDVVELEIEKIGILRNRVLASNASGAPA